MQKIKKILLWVLGAISVVLAALLFRRTKQLDNSESELAKEKVSNEIKENDRDREEAKRSADDLVSEYERLRQQYEDAAGGDREL